MIYEFLTDYRKELLDKCSKLNDELEALRLGRKETEKFSELIASENEQPFSDFSPHVISSRAQEKLKELAHEIDDMDVRFDRIEAEIADANDAIARVDLALEEYHALTEKDVCDADDDILSDPSHETAEIPSLATELCDRLTRIMAYLPADPMRAKLELNDIISDMQIKAD